jgi:hypothetical protein
VIETLRRKIENLLRRRMLSEAATAQSEAATA